MYHSVKEVFASKSYIISIIFNICVSFGINFGIEYAVLTNWGKRHDRDTPCDPDASHSVNDNRWDCVRLGVWEWNSYANSCIAMDWIITCLFLSFFTSSLGTGGAVKEVKQGKCETVDDAALNVGLLKYTPVRVDGLCKRSLLMSALTIGTFGVGIVAILSIALPNGHTWGVWQYCTFKGVVCGFMVVPVYTIVHLAAIKQSYHERLEREENFKKGIRELDAEDREHPPMVGRVGYV